MTQQPDMVRPRLGMASEDPFPRRHRLFRSDVHPPTLAVELSAKLGDPVTAEVIFPAEGAPGEVIVRDHAGVVVDVDPAVVAEVIKAHRPPQPRASGVLADFDTAVSAEAKIQVVRDWLATRTQ